MLVLIVAFGIISICDSAGRFGSYSKLKLTQIFPITPIFYEQIHRPDEDIGRTEKYIKTHHSMLQAQSWVVNAFVGLDTNNKILKACPSSTVDLLVLSEDKLDDYLKKQLKAKWPVLAIDGTNKAQWTIDYMEYGSCISDDPLDYFEKGVKLLDKYNIGSILSKANIQQGETYDWSVIVDSISNTLKKRVNVNCLRPRYLGTKEQYLIKVELCFNKDEVLEDCQSQSKKDKLYACDPNQNVTYPVLPTGYF